jgi:N-acetylmuramoyl-L-alanine amidase
MKRYLLIILIIFFMFTTYCDATEITNVRYWSAPDHTRVVIDVEDEPSFEIQEGKKFLILNFKGGLCVEKLPAEMFINKPGIKKVIFHTEEDDGVKVELVLDKYSSTRVFKLKKNQDKPNRVVVDIFSQETPLKETVREDRLPKSKKKKIIVIDPGHGGDDPGAVGKKGTYEKNIVLAISREIQTAVNKVPGYRAILTRDGDYYVSFNKRLQIAKDSKASLFISIHADAALNRQARGSSVYCLSTGAASNEAAKLLAKNENLADIIGGVPNCESKDSDKIILNMFQTNTINLSKHYAANLIQQLNKVNCLKHESVQEAPFRVLKLPDIPAVLIETAFVSNEEEEKLLKSSAFRKNLTSAIVSSATEYLSGTSLIAQRDNDTEDGDAKTIASPEKKITKKVNDSNKLSRIYNVKKGDTFFSLTKRNSITLDELRKLNHMRDTDSLLWGKKIKLPR